MKKLFTLMVVVVAVATACQKEGLDAPKQSNETSTELAVVNSKTTRSYDEALKIAEDALTLLDGDDTRATKRRVIKRDEGQTIMRPVTRGSNTSEEPIMYIFNNENDEGFTIVAANRSVDPVIAVTEKGNYTYGEPTGVEPFDEYMNNSIELMSFIPTFPPIIVIPNPKPSVYTEYVDIHEEVEPLLSTKWNQDGIYGEYFSNHLSGCTITAVGQVMAYHHHPHYITITFNGSNQSIHLDWAEILKHKIGSEDTDSTCLNNTHTIIGKFLKELAYRSSATSTPQGTRAFLYQTQPVLDEWGYNQGTVQNISSVSTIFSTIMSNLDNDRPVCISGYHYSNNTTGHTWVIDGYHYSSEGTIEHSLNINYNPNDPLSGPEYIVTSSNVETIKLLHFNWGWGGNCDGWFSIDCFDMDNPEEYDSETGNSSSYDWKYGLNVLYDIYPL